MRSKSYFCDLLLLSVVSIWGFNFAIIKTVYAEMNPLAFNALRFLISSLTMLFLLKLRGDSFHVAVEDRKSVFWLALLSNTVYQFLFVIGLANTKAGNAGLLMALTPVFAYLVGVFGRRERFSQSVLAGILLSLTGVGAIILAGSTQVSFGKTWKGDLLMMGAAFCWGWYTGASAGLLSKYGALRLTVLTMVLGTVVLIPLSIPAVVRQNWTAVSLRAWGGFLSSALFAIVYSYFVWPSRFTRMGVPRRGISSISTPSLLFLGVWCLWGKYQLLFKLSESSVC